MPEKVKPARKRIPSTQKEFCAAHEIQPATFKVWLKRQGFDLSKIKGIRRYPPGVAREIHKLLGPPITGYTRR